MPRLFGALRVAFPAVTATVQQLVTLTLPAGRTAKVW
jgi:hypothetical protein